MIFICKWNGARVWKKNRSDNYNSVQVEKLWIEGDWQVFHKTDTESVDIFWNIFQVLEVNIFYTLT